MSHLTYYVNRPLTMKLASVCSPSWVLPKRTRLHCFCYTRTWRPRRCAAARCSRSRSNSTPFPPELLPCSTASLQIDGSFLGRTDGLAAQPLLVYMLPRPVCRLATGPIDLHDGLHFLSSLIHTCIRSRPTVSARSSFQSPLSYPRLCRAYCGETVS